MTYFRLRDQTNIGTIKYVLTLTTVEMFNRKIYVNIHNFTLNLKMTKLKVKQK